MAEPKSTGGNLSRNAFKNTKSIREETIGNPIPQHRRLAMGEDVDGCSWPAEDKVHVGNSIAGQRKNY